MMLSIIRGGREGGGQRVMIEIIISDDNDGRPLTQTDKHTSGQTLPNLLSPCLAIDNEIELVDWIYYGSDPRL